MYSIRKKGCSGVPPFSFDVIEPCVTRCVTKSYTTFHFGARKRQNTILSFFIAFVLISFLCAQPLLSEENPSAEEPLLAEETITAGEQLPEGENLISPETRPGGDAVIASGTRLNEKPAYDEESPVFEAPPLIIEVSAVYESRSFDAVFPGFSQSQKNAAFSGAGLKHSFEKDGSPMLIPAPNSGIDILSGVMKKNPSHVVEALVVVPYSKRELSMLDVYNALGRIENIKDHSILLNGRNYYVFTEATRLESAKSRKPVSDPPPRDTLPYSETMYLRLKEVFLGNIYIRGDLSVSLYGITYSMTNFTDVRYLIFPIMKAERFSTVIYLEPVKEGVLVYSISGLYLPGFIADRVNLTPSINNRITALLSWITDGLRRQENRSL